MRWLVMNSIYGAQEQALAQHKGVGGDVGHGGFFVVECSYYQYVALRLWRV